MAQKFLTEEQKSARFQVAALTGRHIARLTCFMGLVLWGYTRSGSLMGMPPAKKADIPTKPIKQVWGLPRPFLKIGTKKPLVKRFFVVVSFAGAVVSMAGVKLPCHILVFQVFQFLDVILQATFF